MSNFRKRSLWQMFGAIVVAVAFYFAMDIWGRAGDCSPHQIDGQCGMATAFGELVGIAGAAVIVAVTLLGIAIAHGRRTDRK